MSKACKKKNNNKGYTYDSQLSDSWNNNGSHEDWVQLSMFSRRTYITCDVHLFLRLSYFFTRKYYTQNNKIWSKTCLPGNSKICPTSMTIKFTEWNSSMHILEASHRTKLHKGPSWSFTQDLLCLGSAVQFIFTLSISAYLV